MSAYWKGNLLNTIPDLLIDTVVLVLTVCAYVPQISRLHASTSTKGISPYYILYHVFVSNAQLSENLLIAAYAWPNDTHPVLEQIVEGRLSGLAAIGGMMGYVQIAAQWTWSVAVLVSFAVADTRTEGTSGRVVSVVAFLHAAVTVFPVLAIVFPRPSEHSMSTGILIAFIFMSNQVVAPMFGILQFVAQLRRMKAQKGVPGALSLLSLFLQVLAFAALAFRWRLRTGKLPWADEDLRNGRTFRDWDFWDFKIWYEWSFTFVNYILLACGSALLLGFYILGGGMKGPEEADLQERQALLA